MNLFIKLGINIFVLLIVEYLVPGFKFESIWAAVVSAVVLGIVNMLIKPVIQIVALPITILTLGIFAFLINVALLWAVAYFVPGFEISSFSTAIIASLVMTLVTWFLHRLIKD